jgi:hypothetical protein
MSYRQPAKVIPLHPHLADHRLWRAIGFTLLAIVTAMLLVSSMVTAVRSGDEVLSRITPAWPWW